MFEIVIIAAVLAQEVAASMSITELVFAICVPLATVAGALFTWLGTRKKATSKELDEAEDKIDDIRDKLDAALARQDIMLGYIYSMRRRDFEEGREPLPLPPELNMIKN